MSEQAPLPKELPERGAIETYLRDVSGASLVRIADMTPSGEARWDLEISFDGGSLPGSHRLGLILKSDGHLSPVQEFSVRRLAIDSGVTADEPLWLDENGPGLGIAALVVQSRGDDGDLSVKRFELSDEEGDAIVRNVGSELAKLHAIRPSARERAANLPAPPGSDWAAQRAKSFREKLDAGRVSDPVFEWSIAWMAMHAPAIDAPVLTHGDLRSEHLKMKDGALAKIDGFGNATWSDPMADVGSFCARFWRAGAYAREAGGIGSREAFYEGYASIAGEGSIDAQRIAFWEFHATLKAGIDAITGAQVFLGSDVDWYTHEGWRVRAIAAQYDLLMDLAQVALVGR